MPTDALTLRHLNRATLSRQMLLARARITPLEAIEQLVGLQAQLPRPPFVGLWSRLERVDRSEIVRDLLDRRIIRATTLRGTLHLMSAADYRRFRTALQPALDRAMGVLKDRAASLDLDRLVEIGRTFFRQPRTFDAFRNHLLTLYPKGDIRAMAYAVRTRLPLVQVPTDTAWGFPIQADFVTADEWLGKAPAGARALETLVLRYLKAFGPATVADVQAWSYLQGLKPVVDSLRPKLRTFKGEGRAELFDLPEAPRPSPDTPAPVRFVPEWDNLIVSRADARLVAPEHRSAVFRPGLRVLAVVLVDGFVAGVWTAERKASRATLVVDPFKPPPKRVRAAIEEEGEALLRFLYPEAQQVDVVMGSKA